VGFAHDRLLRPLAPGLFEVLLAISIVSLLGANIWTVMPAITVPEIPRVIRLVRSVVLSAREEAYVEAQLLTDHARAHLLARPVRVADDPVDQPHRRRGA
jgi:ABC-type dipeptide/oligopeptide/nickel transport system permease subunit